MIEISYLTEISKTYTNALNTCSSSNDLKKLMREWKEIAYDAFKQVWSRDFSFDEYQKGLEIERSGEFAGEEWVTKYGAILMPGILLFIGLQAIRFHAPEGMVFIRMRELKIIKKRRKNGIYYLETSKSQGGVPS